MQPSSPETVPRFPTYETRGDHRSANVGDDGMPWSLAWAALATAPIGKTPKTRGLPLLSPRVDTAAILPRPRPDSKRLSLQR
jgi:hypothetical protein